MNDANRAVFVDVTSKAFDLFEMLRRLSGLPSQELFKRLGKVHHGFKDLGRKNYINSVNNVENWAKCSRDMLLIQEYLKKRVLKRKHG